MMDRSRPFVGRPVPARGHMPFEGHRTQAEVIEDENRNAIRRSLGRNGKRKARAS
jgi:hypothetical protein